jgi:hypothetical protein
MDIIIYFQHIADSILMSFFRFSDNPVTGYFLGTAILSTICVAVGELSIYLAFRFNKDKIDHTNNDMEHYQHLSIKALKAGNKDAFRACNSIANESFGKSFFMQITLAAASLWPLLFALGWMQYKFAAVDFAGQFSFPGSEYVFGYFTTVVFCYFIVRTIFNKMKFYFLKHRSV